MLRNAGRGVSVKLVSAALVVLVALGGAMVITPLWRIGVAVAVIAAAILSGIALSRLAAIYWGLSALRRTYEMMRDRLEVDVATEPMATEPAGQRILSTGTPRQNDESAHPGLAELDFAHGFVAYGSGFEMPALDGWRTTTLGRLRIALHPLTTWTRLVDGDLGLVLIGQVVDVERSETSIDRVARRLLDVLVANGEPALVEDVAYLGGRFTCIADVGAKSIVVIPDCHASQAVFWSSTDGRLGVSSHSHLLAELTGAERDHDALALLQRRKEMKTGGTSYFPPTMTPFVGVNPLMPNCLLRWRGADSAVSHTRFYPFDDRERVPEPQSAYAVFVELFREHTRLLCQLGRTGISLTGGNDSRATLFAALPNMLPRSFAFTFGSLDKMTSEVRRDISTANDLAFSCELPHRIVDLSDDSDLADFDRAFKRTFGVYAQFRRAARAFYGQLPHDFYQFQSTIAETGTGFYKNRSESTFDAARLAQLYSRSEFGALPEVVADFEAFIDYSQFYPERLHGLDYHDALYWEHRNGRWAALRYHEADLAHRVLLPYNQRRLIEALQAVPIQDRMNQQFQRRFIAENSPQGSPLVP